MAEEIKLTVHSGDFRRENCPVGVVLPIPLDPLDLPTLFRQGRKRPIPCQLEPTPAGTKLWWIVESLAANQQQQFVLSPGTRERQASSRVTATEQSENHFVLRRRDGLGLGLHLGNASEVVRIDIIDGPAGLVRFHQRTTSDGTTVTPSRKPRVQQGPVFASLAIEQTRTDGKGIVAVESFRCRLFDSPDRSWILDCEMTTVATAGRLEINNNNLPAVEIHVSSQSEVVVSPGWKLTDCQRTGPFSSFRTSAGTVRLFFRSTSFGFPPVWRRNGESLLASPSLGEAGRAEIQLGRTSSTSCRLFVVPKEEKKVIDPTDRYFDLEQSPVAVVITGGEELNVDVRTG